MITKISPLLCSILSTGSSKMRHYKYIHSWWRYLGRFFIVWS